MNAEDAIPAVYYVKQLSGLASNKAKKYKYKAQQALESARALTGAQNDAEFRRQLLSNIRQERIARAQLAAGNYSDDYTSSSAAGATANIDSSLAGESIYAYEASKRAEQIQSYQDQAVAYNKKYAKAIEKKAQTSSLLGGAVGAAAGFLVGGPMGAVAGWQIGQGLGQVASNTGYTQTQNGIQNILGGATQLYNYGNIESNYQKYLSMIRNNRYELASVNPTSGQIIPGSQVYAGNYMVLQGLRDYRS